MELSSYVRNKLKLDALWSNYWIHPQQCFSKFGFIGRCQSFLIAALLGASQIITALVRLEKLLHQSPYLRPLLSAFCNNLRELLHLKTTERTICFTHRSRKGWKSTKGLELTDKSIFQSTVCAWSLSLLVIGNWLIYGGALTKYNSSVLGSTRLQGLCRAHPKN